MNCWMCRVVLPDVFDGGFVAAAGGDGGAGVVCVVPVQLG